MSAPECIPERIFIPTAKADVGDKVRAMAFPELLGTVMERHFDNFLHATAWRYIIEFDNGTRLTHLHCDQIMYAGLPVNRIE